MTLGGERNAAAVWPKTLATRSICCDYACNAYLKRSHLRGQVAVQTRLDFKVPFTALPHRYAIAEL